MTPNINEIEKAQWMIGRIDHFQKSLIDELESSATKYENKGIKGISTLKEWRTIGVSSLVALLTIFLTFNSTYPMALWDSFVITISLIIVTIFYFVILTKIIGIVEGILNDIDFMIHEGIGEVSHSYGFFLTRVADIDKTDYAYVENYFNFVMLLSCAIMAHMANEFRKLAQHYDKFHDLKDNLVVEAKSCEASLKFVPYYYERFDPTQEVSKQSLDFINTKLKEYLPKNNS